MALDTAFPDISDRHAAYVAGWPCSIAATATKGRHLLAVRDFACGETVLVSEAYVKALLPSHKKRICAGCMHVGGRRLAIHCHGCGEAWYCSAECRSADASGEAHQGAPTDNQSAPRIPHSMLCPVLAHFGGLKADADMECVLRMCLDVAALQRLAVSGSEAAPSVDKRQHAEPQQPPSDEPPTGAAQFEAGSSGHGSNSGSNSSAAGGGGDHTVGNNKDPPLPTLTCGDFQLLQCHPVAVSERDAQQWRRAFAFLQAVLQRTGWPQPPSLDDMLQWAGRVAANSFSRYGACAVGSTTTDESSDHPQQGAPQHQPEQDTECSAASTAGVVAAPQQHHQQQEEDAAEHRVQSQLQRLQLAQRCLWESTSANGCTSGDRPSDAVSAGPESRPSASDGRAAPGAHGCASNGAAAESAAQHGGAGCGLPPAEQPHSPRQSPVEAPALQPARIIESGTATHPCGTASAGAGPAANAQPVGREVFITASYFNHSCQPNCIIHRRGGMGVVTAQSDIKAGDELCISYIDLELPRSSRQALLQRMFHFACNCERCQQELAEGSAKCRYGSGSGSSRPSCAPKRRGRKARVSR